MPKTPELSSKVDHTASVSVRAEPEILGSSPPKGKLDVMDVAPIDSDIQSQGACAIWKDRQSKPTGFEHLMNHSSSDFLRETPAVTMKTTVQPMDDLDETTYQRFKEVIEACEVRLFRWSKLEEKLAEMGFQQKDIDN